MEIPDVSMETEHKLYPLGTRFITRMHIYRYISDGTLFKWVEEDRWEEMSKIKHPERFFNKETLDWISKVENE